MTMFSKKLTPIALSLTMVFQAGCGTLLYPERQGQERGDKLDPTVLILNGIGLFFFVIPGLVSFAVDFNTGALYLPSEEGASKVSHNSTQNTQMFTIQGKVDAQAINAIIEEQLNIANVLSHDNLQIEEII